MGLAETGPAESSQEKLMGMSRHMQGSNDRDFDSRSRSNISVNGEEAELMSFPRMLMDTSTGRLQSVSGTSDFTLDPQRHNILENVIQLPQEIQPTGVLPDRKTAGILIDSFFTHVCIVFCICGVWLTTADLGLY
ncbi:hypothetical protein F5Y05DRAFT_241894 [Hypoxylon sp. FL0543]|nr:hypothetical protein F5Y05DRAFT_241894 [Hypoxylon sp. FL0543]